MRLIYTVLIILFAALVAVFALQNLQLVTIRLLTVRASLPLAVLVAAVYFLGLLTGGALIGLIRNWVRRASRK